MFRCRRLKAYNWKHGVFSFVHLRCKVDGRCTFAAISILPLAGHKQYLSQRNSIVSPTKRAATVQAPCRASHGNFANTRFSAIFLLICFLCSTAYNPVCLDPPRTPAPTPDAFPQQLGILQTILSASGFFWRDIVDFIAIVDTFRF
jgi:hypothetical protein